ncbi:MAG: hypothetical protein DWQ35_20050 [Planctomycetota bacterium]|nr:MAG: hypothetical protein DWQ35_20050 [Planctomycetota bacterium]REK28383.1 MAG: hypothetical protein DWQ42_05250 [Planctomycetota bacterium]REK48399.1 MAG: hypothetical protein DWQ46_02400 [Planctomycetota bacterium]
MKRKDKRLSRLALAIYSQQQAARRPPPLVELPTTTWQICQRLTRRIELARGRGWQLAERRSRRELRLMLQDLRDHLNAVEGQVAPSRCETSAASVGEIHADLLALQDEFEEVSFDVRGKMISVTTEPIKLEGVDLGRFEICLDWTAIGPDRSRRYRVIALDPNPAASNESVTHPHVQDEVVCEGEGHQSIRTALQQGRLLDFFLIVVGLLRTYNSGSPYISLSEWHGVECSDCGTVVCDDDRWTCEKCESPVCGECYVNCPVCDGIYCAACVTRCEGCDLDICSSCIAECARCRADRCPDCLEENERCRDCHEREAEEASEYEKGCTTSSQSCDAGTPV